MILNEEQLSAAVHGWVDKETAEGYTYFYRFTKKQREYYAASRFATKERASSSLYVEFVTDATSVAFDYVQKKGSSQNFYFFDLYLNGEMVYHDGNPSFRDGETARYVRALPAGEKTVRIYFPNLSATGIKDVELTDATLFRPTEKKIRYVAYGDSITQGYTTTSPSLCYVNLLGESFDADIYNLGIGGEIFEPMMLDENYPVKADIVTVAYGTNDWRHVAAEEDATRRKGFFDGLTKIHKGAKIFVILPIWRGDPVNEMDGYGTLEDYRELLRREMKEYPEITVVEGENLVPRHPDFFMPDLLHPNALGFTQYARNLKKSVSL